MTAPDLPLNEHDTPMALKKSELYSSLWQSCDELRGGMDASQYKDYVLVLLFIKYVSDKYAGQPFAPISIPPGASFADMVALKGKPTIGDDINKKIVGPLGAANKLSDLPDFNDATKLGTGKEMVERLTNLIAIFENKALDFSKNRADGDDILGDAYEYLMRHFATESGKSKGQFYTPAEVSVIMAWIIGIHEAKTTNDTTAYDPTCGSGSLLLKVGDAATAKITLYGQEKDAATSGLARMNMILHDNPTALVVQGNTLADPKFRDGQDGQGGLKTFDYVVANFPFSDKRWSTGLDPANDPFDRFKPFGTPPAKQGDYAYLLHIVRSLKSTGRGACILPHGVLFRGNAEADIRRALVRKGYILGRIGLPANLFYGTGIPACIVVIDKRDAAARVAARTGIFMIDASRGFMKDGPKNRLRDRDIHQIVDVFTRRQDVPGYARQVPLDEIEKNDFNLNLPRYIDSQQAEDLQDIEGHLRGGIPAADIDALQPYWAVCPQLRQALFTASRPGYLALAVGVAEDKAAIKTTIYGHAEFAAFIQGMNALFADWRQRSARTLKALQPGCKPKAVIAALAEDLLAHYAGKPLIDRYAVYQHLMDYWAATMQDDVYLIAADGWKAEPARVIETDKQGREKDKRLGLRPGAQGASRGALLRQGPGGHRPTRRRPGMHGRTLDRIGRRARWRRGRVLGLRQDQQGRRHRAAARDQGRRRAGGRGRGAERLAGAGGRRGRAEEAPEGRRGRARRRGLCAVPEVERGRDPGPGGGRQVAGCAGRRHPRRDGPHQPGADAAGEGAGRAVRGAHAGDGGAGG